MSNSAYSPASSARRRWLLFLPFALVAALAVAWTGLWFYTAARGKTEIAAWRERELLSGRRQDCASESVAGYPFRLEMRCDGAGFELKGKPTLRLKLPFLLAAVQVYAPSLLISEFTGPLEIAEPERAPSHIVNWRLGQASIRGAPSEVERASLVLEALTVRDMGIAEIVLTAQRVELHARRVPGSTLEIPLIETVLRLNGAVADRLHPLTAKSIDADVATLLHGVADISPQPWPVRFREWQARAGRIEIVKARIVQEDVIAVGAGSMQLTPRGGLDGNLQVTVVGIEKLLRMLDIERIMSEGQIGATISALERLIPGLGGIARQSAAPGLVAALGQRTVLEGRPAVAFPVRFADGTIFLGSFQVGMVPPLF